MKLRQATNLILESVTKMNAIFKEPVFDEFSIVQFVDDTHYLCWYKGNRRQEYIRKFKEDTARLKKASRSRLTNNYEIGDYEFVSDATGFEAESFLVIGEMLFLILTNTRYSMLEIEQNPLWLKAQVPFVEMADRFATDPLVLSQDDFKEKILI